MTVELRRPAKLTPGDKVAIVSPSFAAPGAYPAVHEQAMTRIRDVLGLVPVEYPTTRRVGSGARERAGDLNAAFADPQIRAVFATLGGEDQITVVAHLDADAITHDPKPFLGYSDNTNILSWLWTHGVAGFYGGSTQVHLGAGPGIDACHLASLRAALFTGERLEITEPGESEDLGVPWDDPAALTSYGEREPTQAWTWAGPARAVTGRTWGGCIEVMQWLLTAGRFPQDASVLDGGVLLLETSEEVIPAREFGWILRSLGERGVLDAVAAVVVARPVAANLESRPDRAARAAHRGAQRDTAIEIVGRYNNDAVVCVGPPFGHSRPQWIVPYGGELTVDGERRRMFADYR